jgi:hypothetical protein
MTKNTARAYPSHATHEYHAQLSDAEMVLHMLRLPSIARIINTNPDANWEVRPQRKALRGDCYIYNHPSPDNLPFFDIRDIANGADANGWTYTGTPINRTLPGGYTARLDLIIFQPFTEDELSLLRGIGTLTKVTSTPHEYESLACRI